MYCSEVNDAQLYFLNMFHEDHNSTQCLMGNVIYYSLFLYLFFVFLSSDILLFPALGDFGEAGPKEEMESRKINYTSLVF